MKHRPDRRLDHRPEWVRRLIAAIGLQAYDETAPGKHSRGKRKKKGWRKHRKVKQQMTKASRKRNRANR